jgi:Sec-independent protein translocase protein TatA
MSLFTRGRPSASSRVTVPAPLRHWALGGLTLLGVVGATALSLLSGTPTPLPGVALGAPALLYLERAAAGFTVYLLVLIVLVHAFVDGKLPDEVRGLKYNLRETQEETSEAIDRLAEANEQLRERVEALEALLRIDDDELE